MLPFKKILIRLDADGVRSVFAAIGIELLLGCVYINLSIFSPVKKGFEDFSMIDAYYEISSSTAEKRYNDEIKLLDIGSIYDRGEIGHLIELIGCACPKVLAIDILFESNKADAIADSILENAISTFPKDKIVTALQLTDYDFQSGAFRQEVKSFFQSYVSARLGYTNLVDNMQELKIRNYTLCQRFLQDTVYSLPAATATTLGQDFSKTTNSCGIDYEPTFFETIPCDSILACNNADMLRNKIVILGSSDAADMHNTPIGKMSGMEIQAYILQTIMKDQSVTDMSVAWGVFIGMVFCYFMVCIIKRTKAILEPFRGLCITFMVFLLSAIWVGIGFICYKTFHYNLNMLFPLLGLSLSSFSLKMQEAVIKSPQLIKSIISKKNKNNG